MGNCPQSDRELTCVGIFLEKIVEKYCLFVVVVIWEPFKLQNSLILNKINDVFYYHPLS